MSQASKLIIGFGVLIFIGTVIAGLTIPAEADGFLHCGAPFAGGNSLEDPTKWPPGSWGAEDHNPQCHEIAQRALPGYFISMGVGVLVVFAGLLTDAREKDKKSGAS